jgi:glycosyltransferase involved in cell wall biosynthesis
MPASRLPSLSLTLFFTQGVSLATWEAVGMLKREVALYRGLAQAGLGVRFVTYGGQQDAALAAHIPEIEILCNRRALPDWLYARWAARRVPNAPGQIVKSNQVPGAQVALKAARRSGAAFVARCGYLFSLNEARQHGEQSARARAARQLESRIFPAADRAVVTTPVIRAALIERYSVDPERIRVIPNYVLTDHFAPAASLSHTPPRLVFVGRLASEKNLFALLEAVAPLDVELLIIGEGPQRAELEAVAAKGKAAVSFLGAQPHLELPALLNSCDVYVQPSFYEGHPKTLIEAMSCGLPVIGGRVSGIEELIQHGQTGLLCETSPEGIRAPIHTLLDDSAMRERLGAAARQYVLEHFSLEKVLELELALYAELAAERA